MVYPSGAPDAELRSHDRHIELADRAKPVEDGEQDYFGVKAGQSFLIGLLPQLDIIDHLPIDYMHNCLLGKIVWEETI